MSVRYVTLFLTNCIIFILKHPHCLVIYLGLYMGHPPLYMLQIFLGEVPVFNSNRFSIQSWHFLILKRFGSIFFVMILWNLINLNSTISIHN